MDSDYKKQLKDALKETVKDVFEEICADAFKEAIIEMGEELKSGDATNANQKETQR